MHLPITDNEFLTYVRFHLALPAYALEITS
jgi:hypothetical protein